MKSYKQQDTIKVNKLMPSLALLLGFTLAVGASIENFIAAFCIALPIAIALNLRHEH